MFWLLAACVPREDLFAWYRFADGTLTLRLYDASDPAREATWVVPGLPADQLEG